MQGQPRICSFIYKYFLPQCFQVLSLKLYKAKKEVKETKNDKSSQSQPKQESDKPSVATPSNTSLVSQESQQQKGMDPLEGLDDITRACFEVSKKSLSYCAMAILSYIAII